MTLITRPGPPRREALPRYPPRLTQPFSAFDLAARQSPVAPEVRPLSPAWGFPADIRKDGCAFDLPIAVGILTATEQISAERLGEWRCSVSRGSSGRTNRGGVGAYGGLRAEAGSALTGRNLRGEIPGSSGAGGCFGACSQGSKSTDGAPACGRGGKVPRWKGPMTDSPKNENNIWSRIADTLPSGEFWIGAIALVSFIIVLAFYPQPIGVASTWFPIVMGLLGASVFVLYDIVKSKSDGQGRLTVLRLLLGPIAGWLAYAMVAPQVSASDQAQVWSVQKQWVWLPFLAGFSSDLLVGIINQAIRAIKLTLGIDRPPSSDDQPST